MVLACEWYERQESNLHSAEFEAAASASWATLAQRGLRSAI